MPVVIRRWERGSLPQPSTLLHTRMYAHIPKHSSIENTVGAVTLRKCANGKTANGLKHNGKLKQEAGSFLKLFGGYPKYLNLI